MTIRVALHHETRYHYDRRVQMGPQVIRLRPAPHSRTPVVSYGLHIEPAAHFLNWQQDPFGNYQARVVIPDPVQTFAVSIDQAAELADYNPYDFVHEEDAEEYPFNYEALTRKDLGPYHEMLPRGDHLARWLPRRSPVAVERTTRAPAGCRFLGVAPDFLHVASCHESAEVGA